MARVRAGDREAFRVLVERYQGRVARLALRVLRDEDLAEDAVQEAFLRAYQNLDRFEGRSSFYTWLYRLTMNLCLDLRRRARPDSQELGGARSLDEPGEAARLGARSTGEPGWRQHEESPAQALERSELRAAMLAAIDTLPEAARETLWLRDVEGLSYAEIASTLGIPKGTVMSRLFYARRRVRDALREKGLLGAGPCGSARSAAGASDPEAGSAS